MVEGLGLKEVLLVGCGLEEVEVLPAGEALMEVGLFLRPKKEFINASVYSPYFKLTFCLVFPQMAPIIVTKIQQSICYDGKSAISWMADHESLSSLMAR